MQIISSSYAVVGVHLARPAARGRRVQVRGKFSRIRLIPSGKILRSRFTKGYTEVVIPRLDTHAMVIAEA